MLNLNQTKDVFLLNQSAGKTIFNFGIPTGFHNKSEIRYGQTQGFHTDRAAGGHRYYCVANGDIDAGPSPGQRTGQNSYLPKPFTAIVALLDDVHLRL